MPVLLIILVLGFLFFRQGGLGLTQQQQATQNTQTQSPNGGTQSSVNDSTFNHLLDTINQGIRTSQVVAETIAEKY